MNDFNQNENATYKFTLNPLRQIYYSDIGKTEYGVFIFETDTELPEAEKHSLSYNNDESNYKYISTITGRLPRLSNGTFYNVEAKLVFNSKFKKWQYEIVAGSLSVNRPTSIEDSKKFLQTILSSNQSSVLLEHYPNIVEELIANKDFKPDFTKLKGIKEATFEKIKNKIFETYHMSDLLTMLAPLGVSFNMIKKLFADENDIEILKQKINETPYEFSKLQGIGFKKVDDFALKIKPELINSEQRAIACTQYLLEDIAENEGHTWIYFDNLKDQIRQLIPECAEGFKSFYIREKEASRDNKNLFLFVDEKENRVGLMKYFKIEKHIWKLLNNINEAPNIYNEVNIDKGIKLTNEENGFELTKEQEELVYAVKNNNFIILNGKAGTGKTSATKAVIKTFSKYNMAICALSARASIRSKEVTGLEKCSTIHRLLEYNPKMGGFQRNKDCRLSEDIIILDEMSMLNVGLFLSLLQAIKPSAKLIIIGDTAQLPPIGAGAFAFDLLDSNFKSIQLTKLQRQALDSGIAIDANQIREGISPLIADEISPKPIAHGINKDMFYSLRFSSEDLNDKVISTFKYLINDKNINPKDIMIITPMKTRGDNSTQPINKSIQDILLPSEEQRITYGEKEFRLGDKIIQKLNNYDKNIFNGEVGYIINICPNSRITDVDGNEVFYDFQAEFPDDNGTKIIHFSKSEMANIELAYALTIHSAQGGQSPYVIVIIDKSHYVMLDATLLYTGITRAKKQCYCIANPDAFAKSISNNKVKFRLTHLKRFIESGEKFSEERNKELENENKIEKAKNELGLNKIDNDECPF